MSGLYLCIGISFISFFFLIISGMVLPVKQNELYAGLAELNGLIRLDKETLVLEYNLKDDVLGMFNSELKVLKIPLHAIEDARVKKKWFSARFELYLNRLPKTDKTLSVDGNSLRFIIKKGDLEVAASLRSTLMLRVSEERLRRIDDEDSPGESDPPDFQFYTRKESSPGLKNMLE